MFRLRESRAIGGLINYCCNYDDSFFLLSLGESPAVGGLINYVTTTVCIDLDEVERTINLLNHHPYPYSFLKTTHPTPPHLSQHIRKSKHCQQKALANKHKNLTKNLISSWDLNTSLSSSRQPLGALTTELLKLLGIGVDNSSTILID